MPRQFTLPDLGEGIAEAQIVRVLVKPNDQVKEDQYLMEVETDKAAVEIPSPFAGVVKEVHVKEGQTVNVGDVIVTFDDGESAPAEKEKEA
ncbi:MAG: biotin/lipoyl-binding protein, partial [Planctomycetota bacterium]